MQKNNNDDDILSFSDSPPPEPAIKKARVTRIANKAGQAEPVKAPQPESQAQAGKPAAPQTAPVKAPPEASQAQAKPAEAPKANQAQAAPQAAQKPAETQKPVEAAQAKAKTPAEEMPEIQLAPKASDKPATQEELGEDINSGAPLFLPSAHISHIKNLLDRVRESRACKFISGLSLKAKLILGIIFVPALCVLFYYGVFASPMYITETRFAVRGSDASGMSGIMALVPAASPVGMDANIIAEYIQSPDIMEEIDREIGILSHFSSDKYDILTRLSANATRDAKLSYWQWAVKPKFDLESGIISLEVKAYEPEEAQKLAETVLAKSEALVNTMNERARTDAIAQAMEEVRTAEKRVKAAQEALREFRNKSGMLDPVSTAGGLQSIVSNLESEAVKTRAEIAQASTYMSKNAPALVGLKARLAALEKQLESEKQRLAGEETRPDSLTAFAGDFQALQTESEFATKQLVSAMTALESARVKAEAKSRYVVAFQKPALPDESLYPQAWLLALYVFFATLVCVALGSLIIAAVREHAGF